ncbi:AraC family transcriptional regulator [Aeoliella sp. ICT_H6.2]|uniref:AraC family transcriptional regulator n=1 Tax=Aeoliella straminimaris TaxID=2954799 RepID=A0A9X2JI25_9BACT|nr:AraC family transcriptional regulator [Aeoliella straminimaris]MCO6045223.1 AraC family transcriptional regulator [Aeoliella straminimaris]
MSTDTSQRQAVRLESDQLELAERIARLQPDERSREVRPGLFFNRANSPGDRVHGMAEPSLCVIAQGGKQVLLGEEQFRYDAAHYLITTMQVPLVGQVVEATPEEPYLSFRSVLDPAVVTSVMVESGHVQPGSDASMKAVDVSPLDAGLLDAAVRLVRLIDTPDEYPVLGPLVMREIVFRLLTGAQAARLRHLATFGGQGHRMARAVDLIRENFDRPLRVEDVAREVAMSVSGFHSHFKAATAMSPLQFQKQLRLQEARRLMLNEDFDAAQAGFRVGYEDASQFSREYKRHFGNPPKRDVEQLREMTANRAG